MEKELLYFFKKYPKSKIDDYVRTILQSEFFRERKKLLESLLHIYENR